MSESDNTLTWSEASDAAIGDDPLITMYHGDVAQLIINRPGARNAMTLSMWRDLPARLDEIARRSSIGALVIRGAGGRAFCSGADIAEFDEIYTSSESALAANQHIERAQRALEAFPRPTIAVISGACVGGGLGLALSCDARLATNSARFAVTPVRLGLAYSPADTIRLVRHLGIANCKDLLLSGRSIGADEAMRMGLVQLLTDSATLVERAHAWVQAHRTDSPNAQMTIKRLIHAASGIVSLPPEQQQAMFEARFQGEEFKAAVARFKRRKER